MQETRVQSLVGKSLWRREWQSTPVLFPGESHRQRSLVGYIPWGHRVRHDWATNTHNVYMSVLISQFIAPPLSSVVVVQLFSRVWLFTSPWTAAQQAFLSFTISWSLLKLIPIKSVMPSNHLILCHPSSSHLQSLPASGSFLMSQFFASGDQSIGALALASVPPMNIQDWFPLGLTGLIPFQSKGISRVLSNITVHKHQFFNAQPSLCSNYHIQLVQFSHSVVSNSLWLHELVQMSHPFSSVGQSIGVLASTSGLPMNIQDLFPLG